MLRVGSMRMLQVKSAVAHPRTLPRALNPHLAITALCGTLWHSGHVDPIITSPSLPHAPVQVKDLLMALYFAADHVVWAHQIGLLQDKRTGERAQKVSLWSWALGSVTTMILEANTILAVSGKGTVDVGRKGFCMCVYACMVLVVGLLPFVGEGLLSACKSLLLSTNLDS
jgi:hypothetical protein